MQRISSVKGLALSTTIFLIINLFSSMVVADTIIQDNSPDTAGTGDNFIVNASVTDDVGIDNVYVEYWFDGGTKTKLPMINTGCNYWEYDGISIPSDSDDDLYYDFYVKNSSNGWHTLRDLHVVVSDDDSPVISVVQANPSSTYRGIRINITCNVVDNIDVDEVKVNIIYPDSSHYNETMLRGCFYYNSSYDQVGTYRYFIWADDIFGNSAVSSDYYFEILDHLPVITTGDDTSATEGISYSTDYDAIDDDGDTLTWSLETNAPFLSIEPSTGILSGTPGFNHDGSYWVNVTVHDGCGGIDYHNFTLNVININDFPVITTIDDTTAIEDQPYSRDYAATDNDGDVLMWYLETNASFLGILPATGILYGTPDNSHVGSYWVNVTVIDGKGGFDFSNFTLTVINVNDAPVITSIDVTDAVEDQQYSSDYAASDDDGDSLTWSLQTNASFLSILPSYGILYGTPGFSDDGTYWVNVSVGDGAGGFDFSNFSLTVVNVNDPPVITSVDDTDAFEDQFYYLDYDATDVDGDNLTWSLNTNASFLSINTNSGFLLGIPENSHVGSYWVNITVDDGRGGIDYHNFTLTVININDAPVITTIDDTTAIEDFLYLNDYAAIDDEGDTLTWYLDTNATSFLIILPVSGMLYGTPDNSHVGSYWVNVSVNDGNGGIGYSNFTLIVINQNDPPVIITIDDLDAVEDQPYSVDYDATDEEGDLLSWLLDTNASFLSINTVSGVLSGTPGNTDPGSYWVNISVNDGNGGIDYHNFTLTVININDPPVITTIDVTKAEEDKPYYVDYDAVDYDNDPLNWSFNTNASFLSIIPSTGILNGSPNNSHIGLYWVNVTVSDGKGGIDYHNFTLNVSIKNIPPETPSDPDPVNGSSHNDINLDLSWISSDPDGVIVTYDVYFGTTSTPSIMVANQSDRTYDPGELEYNTRYYWRIIAWDILGASAIGPLWEFDIGERISPGPPESPQLPSVSPNNPPFADATAGEPYLGVVREQIIFDGTNSYDSDGDIVNYSWDFGDGEYGYGVSIAHAYDSPGEYTVILTVKDDDGAKDTFETIVIISQPNRVPSTPIVDGPQNGSRNTQYNYTAMSIDLDNDSIQYHFSWGDGTANSTEFLPNGTTAMQMHKWAFAGLYTLVVKAFDNQILSNTTVLSVLIDAIMIDGIGYLTDDDGDGVYDRFHNGSIETDLGRENGLYLIDVDDDGDWDLNFDIDDGISDYKQKEEFDMPWLIIFVLIIIILLIINCVFYLYKTRYFGILIWWRGLTRRFR